MSSSNDRYFGTTYSKSRRSSPESQGGFFQTGQGGRTVLPPISSAFPISRFPVPSYSSQYTPRSSPARYEVNQQVLYQYASPEPASTYPIYETHDRYATPSQGYSYGSRSTPPLPATQPDNRKLPPLATNTTGGWTTAYLPMNSTYQPGGPGSSIRSPTASYPTQYAYQAPGATYTYLPTQEHGHMNPPAHIPSYEVADPSRDHQRPSSPYTRSSSHVSAPAYTPPPVSPTSPDESTIKKKRKRADARQLKVLNETYNRTAFPSTEERLALAKELDMSARSVQIWFQNKRQSMRQTNRQSTSGSQPFSMPGDLLEELEPSVQMGYGTPHITVAEPHYTSRHSSETSRPPHTSQPTSRRVRHNEEPEPRKWFN
ncbi:hypothetical protein H0H81_009172 [Sphagnurus paluster]|uniref:Homeobox domain-containing protein n=1 Tax=Sphagnurus paluster TaxID=117069 RepID=A0A9P7FXF1_9AGAR|nr:hypothetical protein H0H81_009172 [Sphagnurus paluster]